LAASRSSSATPPGERVQFETLLSDISAQLIAVGSDRLEETIQSALDAMRRFFEVGRCALLSISDNLETVHVAYAAYAEGASHVSGEVDLAPLLPWLRRRLVVDREPVAV
jgi:hypothetical protein